MMNFHTSFPWNYPVIHESAGTPIVAADASSRISSWTAVESTVCHVCHVCPYSKGKFPWRNSEQGHTGCTGKRLVSLVTSTGRIVSFCLHGLLITYDTYESCLVRTCAISSACCLLTIVLVGVISFYLKPISSPSRFQFIKTIL